MRTIVLAALSLCLFLSSAEAAHRKHKAKIVGPHVSVCRQCNNAAEWSIDLVAKARHYSGMTASQIGLNRRSQWCAAFLRYLGVKGPVDDRAISFNRLPHVQARVGAIAVYPHHVGIVTGFDGRYPIIISGNSYQRRVYEGTYPRTPIAYVNPI